MKSVDDQLIEEYVSRFTKGTRQWAFDAFDTWCLADLKHRVYVLMAGAGVGKTGILSKLARDRLDIVVAYHFCRHDDPRRSDPIRMLCSLAYQLASSFPTYKEALVALKLTRKEIKEFNVNSLFNHLFIGPLGNMDEQ